MTNTIYGIHDMRSSHLNPSWIVGSFDVRETNHIDWQGGAQLIARLNWSHHGQGTIPVQSNWLNFADLCAQFVRSSPNVSHFIVGNEPNHPVEQIPGQPKITPKFYIDCFQMVCVAIRNVRPDVTIMPAAIAPWSVSAGLGWVGYAREVYEGVGDCPNAFAIHAYAREYKPSSVTSNQRWAAPYSEYFESFRCYIDFLEAIPLEMRHVPVHITEANGNGPWPNEDNGFVAALYDEVNRHNHLSGTQSIHSLSLFRYNHFEGQVWGFENKPAIVSAFKQARQKGYTVPEKNRLFVPVIRSNKNSALEWDTRLNERGVRIEEVHPDENGMSYQVVSGRWLDEQESQGRHHIFMELFDLTGNRVPGAEFLVTWPSGSAKVHSRADGMANFALSPSLNEFSVRVSGSVPSEIVTGIGMGANNNPGIHTSTVLAWSLTESDVENVVTVKAPAGANVRQLPSLKAPVLTVAPFGTRMEWLATTGLEDAWHRVRLGDEVGWIYDTVVNVRGQVEMVEVELGDDDEIDVGFIPLNIRSLLSFLDVESGNRPFIDNLLTIRFEVHRFEHFLNNQALFDRHFRYDKDDYNLQFWRPNPESPWLPAHGPNEKRHELLRFAREFNNLAALNATGMGMGQIMGHNARRVGFVNPEEMFETFSDHRYGPTAQIIAFINYILSDNELYSAIMREDWTRAIQLYNGFGQEEKYLALLKNSRRILQERFGL